MSSFLQAEVSDLRQRLSRSDVTIRIQTDKMSAYREQLAACGVSPRSPDASLRLHPSTRLSPTRTRMTSPPLRRRLESLPEADSDDDDADDVTVERDVEPQLSPSFVSELRVSVSAPNDTVASSVTSVDAGAPVPSMNGDAAESSRTQNAKTSQVDAESHTNTCSPAPQSQTQQSHASPATDVTRPASALLSPDEEFQLNMASFYKFKVCNGCMRIIDQKLVCSGITRPSLFFQSANERAFELLRHALHVRGQQVRVAELNASSLLEHSRLMTSRAQAEEEEEAPVRGTFEVVLEVSSCVASGTSGLRCRPALTLRVRSRLSRPLYIHGS